MAKKSGALPFKTIAVEESRSQFLGFGRIDEEMKFHLYDVVRLLCPKEGVGVGAKGTIVMTYEFPREGYDVEFLEVDQQGLVLTLYPEELDLVISWDRRTSDPYKIG